MKSLDPENIFSSAVGLFKVDSELSKSLKIVKKS